MALILTIKASTTTDEIEAAIQYVDMRKEAIERRDDAAAVLAEQGDQAVLEYHDVDGVSVLYSPDFSYAYVNQSTAGIGDSMLIDNGVAESPEYAARVWIIGGLYSIEQKTEAGQWEQIPNGGFNDLAEAVDAMKELHGDLGWTGTRVVDANGRELDAVAEEAVAEEASEDA